MPRKAKTRKPIRKAAVRKKAAPRRTAKKRVAAKKTAGRRKVATQGKKTTSRKTTAKKVASNTTKKTAKAVKKISIGGLKQAYTKAQITDYLARSAELSKKDINNVFDALNTLMVHHLKPRGPGEFTFPGLLKCFIRRKPPTKARKGVNPFTGEEMMFKAKPARKIVKVRPLKKLKEMAE